MGVFGTHRCIYITTFVRESPSVKVRIDQEVTLAERVVTAEFEQDMVVEVLQMVVEAEFALFEVDEEGVPVHASEPGQAALGIGPEALDAVDVIAADVSTAKLVA